LWPGSVDSLAAEGGGGRRQVKASREEREAKPREEELDQHRAAHDIRR